MLLRIKRCGLESLINHQDRYFNFVSAEVMNYNRMHQERNKIPHREWPFSTPITRAIQFS